MEHFANELDVGRLVGVVFGELEFELKESSFPGGRIDAFDGGWPFEEIVANWHGDDLISWLFDAFEVFEQSSLSRCGHIKMVNINKKDKSGQIIYTSKINIYSNDLSQNTHQI